MKLSISNIAWDKTKDKEMHDFLSNNGFLGIEIAPTRIIEKSPYSYIDEAVLWKNELNRRYDLNVSSIQSIWYGKKERLFGSKEEREELFLYTKKAIDFASAIKCKNLVFGCPRNRIKPENMSDELAIEFFREIGDYAFKKNTCVSIEANPTIYNTNFINTTSEAIDIIKRIDSLGVKLNLDLGTMIYNTENINILNGNVHLVNHVHISEPMLSQILERDLHKAICVKLKEENYNGYISIEMKKNDSISEIQRVCSYVKKVVEDVKKNT